MFMYPPEKAGAQELETITGSRGIAAGFSSWGVKTASSIRRGNAVPIVDALSTYKAVAKNNFVVYRYRDVFRKRAAAASISAATPAGVIVSVPITIHHFNPPNLRFLSAL